MSPATHTRADEIARGLRRCRPVAFSGRVLRVAKIEYANTDDLISCEGNLRFGGRYNPKGCFRAVYASLELDTATAELLAHHRRLGRPDPDADVFPIAAVSLEVDVDRLLDLTSANVRRLLKINLKDLDNDWQTAQNQGREALTQAIGRLALAAGYQGLFAPSAAKRGGRNVILFRDMVSERHLRIVRKEKLPKKT